jgi:cytochrome c-type biogenesis protein CcmH
MKKRSLRSRSLPFLLLCLALLLALPASAQESVTDDEVNEVAKDLYCPVCENTPLDVCPTQACQDWRAEIRAQLSEGKSKEEIQQYFVEQHGARVLAEPPSPLLRLLPIAAVLIGGAFFILYLRGLRREEADADDTFDVAQGGAQAPPPAASEDDYVSQVEKEVREE